MAHSDKKVKILFSCLDWRLHPQIEEYFTREGNGCDSCVTAGSIKGLLDESTREFFLGQIDISKKLHNCQAVILTAHIDCGAYGGSAAFGSVQNETASHKEMLNQAAEIVAKIFPGMPIEKYIIGLELGGDSWKINPQTV